MSPGFDNKTVLAHNYTMKTRGFYPTEIIFSATTACNLLCEHCFINRELKRIDITTAESFLRNCVEAGGTVTAEGIELPRIERVGFTGGEPFLYLDFLLALTKATIENDLLFDQIMTNGDWWKDEADLCEKLQALYDAGYDGKIGLSWDSYHGQSEERMQTFIRTVQEIFGEEAINIQTVEDEKQVVSIRPSDYSTTGVIPVYNLPRTYPSDDPRAWQARRWFKEDYCEGPGQMLYVHADGNIAPCCGFANENPKLFIGTIHDSLEQIMQNAAANPMIQICYKEGLSHYRRHGLKKSLHSQGKKLPGKCSDICSFCDFVCKQDTRD